MFGSAQPSSSPFGTPSFATPSSTPAFGTPSSTPAFGASSTPAFGSSLLSTPFSSQPQQQQQQQLTPLFQQQQPTSSPFGFQSSLAAPQPSPFSNAQLTTQMANVAPVPFSLADRDVQVSFFLFSSTIHFSNFCFCIVVSLINFVFACCAARQSLMLTRKILETPSTLSRYPPHCLIKINKYKNVSFVKFLCLVFASFVQ